MRGVTTARVGVARRPSIRGGQWSEAENRAPETAPVGSTLGRSEVTLSEAGLPAALDQAYQEHFAFVWRTLRRYGVPDQSLEDAVQDVFVVAQVRLTSFEGRSAVRSWLFGIARRLARDYRPSGRLELLQPDILESMPACEVASPLVALERQERARLLHELLSELPDDKREVFVLVELEQLPVAEAAMLLRENVNTLASRLRAARQDLAQALARRKAQDAWRDQCRADPIR